MQKIKVHDVVVVSKNYPDKDENHYGNHDYHGVVVAIDEDSVSIKQENGETENYKYQGEDYDKSKYSHRIGDLSEIEYAELIDKDIEYKRSILERYEKELAQTLKWKHTFTYEVSLLGKLGRMFKHE